MKINKKSLVAILFGCLFAGQIVSGAESDSGKGIGPVKEVKLEELNLDVAKKGKDVFTAKCSACHKMSERYVGPELGQVFKRRQPEWIMNMILNPAEMLQKDPVAQELLGEYLTQMPFQSVSQDEVRGILEYFRYYSEKGEIAEAKAGGKKTQKKK